MMAKNKPIQISVVIFFIIGLFVAFIMLIPFVWMFSVSFKLNAEIFTIPIRWIPEVFRLDNYKKVWIDYSGDTIN
jgi:multiple sugar transport system permease protein